MFNRKEIQANQRKKISENECSENEVIYSLKRKMGEIGAQNIYFSNEEEIMNFYKSRKYVQVGMNELIEMTEAMSFDQNQQKIVILQKITEEQKSYYKMREQLSQNLRQNVKNDLFSRNRQLFQQNQQIENKKTIIPLINEDNILFCHNQNTEKQITQQYETEDDDFYMMKTVKKEDLGEINEMNKVQLNTRTIEKYFNFYPYQEEEPIDSEDSQRTDNSKFDYPEDEESDQENKYDEEYDGEEYNDNDYEDEDNDRFSNCDTNQKQQDCKEEIEIDEEPNQKIDGGADFLKFLQLHKNYIADKQNWRTFQYENDF